MLSLCRIIPKQLSASVSNYFIDKSLLNVSKKTYLYPLVKYTSDKCGSDKKDSGSKGSKGDGEPCGPCQPCQPCEPCGPWCCPCPPAEDGPSSPSMYDVSILLLLSKVRCRNFEEMDKLPDKDCRIGLIAGHCNRPLCN